jgi:hypothetical protein
MGIWGREGGERGRLRGARADTYKGQGETKMTDSQPTPPSVQPAPAPAVNSTAAPAPASTLTAQSAAAATTAKPSPTSDPVQELDTSRAPRWDVPAPAISGARPAQFSSLMEAMLGGAVVLGMGPPPRTTAQSPKKKSSSGRRSPPEVRDVTEEEEEYDEDVGSQTGTPSLSESEVTEGDEQDGKGEEREHDEDEDDEEEEDEEAGEGGDLDSMDDPRLWAAMGLGAKPPQTAGMGGVAAVATQMRHLEQYLEHIHHASGMLFHSRHISEIDTVALRQDLLGATEHPLEMYKAAVHALLAVIEMSQKVDADADEEEEEEDEKNQIIETKSQPASVVPVPVPATTAIPPTRSHKHRSSGERPRKRSSVPISIGATEVKTIEQASRSRSERTDDHPHISRKRSASPRVSSSFQ